MIGVAQRIFSFLVLLGIIIFAFAHSLHLLLRPITDYSYNQPNYNNDVNNPWNLVTRYKSITPDGAIGNDFLIETPDANTNLFSAFKTAIVAVYFMLTGDLSSVSSWNLNENWTLVALLVIFSFFTTIYLLNLFIGLLSTAIENTNNDESFLQLKREILSEIELFWMLPYQRRRKDWFPEIIYYEATIEELQKYVQKIQSENCDESSKPFIFPHIYKIAKLDAKTIDEKLNDLDGKFQDLIEDIKRLKSEN
ncbi:hypothetical protein C2G38_1653131 [Gigaspora rosea]|uniref:Ion transport domain-containing protein n=1 Tax=Gigaspora rosea TaxID=44941 RepID=A0A397UXZ9_9GLOM|nr:hypothetical protein C2G38_1653131 [Gigaspora rosea]